MKLLDVSVSSGSHEEILRQVKSFLAESKFHRIATVNPEFLVMADRNPAFKQSLLSADLCVADGFGIVLTGLLHGEKITRFPGVDLMHEILAIAQREGHAVFLAIRQDGLSSYEEIRASLLKKYPRLSIDGGGVPMTESWENYKLKAKSSKLLMCNFGAPTQELFLESVRNDPGDVRLAVGVGGSFDYLTGKQKRAPEWWRALGLEWLWRLLLQPKRWKRIWNAVVVFPMKVLLRSRTPK